MIATRDIQEITTAGASIAIPEDFPAVIDVSGDLFESNKPRLEVGMICRM